mmetsp:Transcript_87976/g.249237  ORF Transcript_87976/g.249237 Transcript_87976/m.249237 type:complete len:308 (-) Transcript_87976:38-961(-)
MAGQLHFVPGTGRRAAVANCPAGPRAAATSGRRAAAGRAGLAGVALAFAAALFCLAAGARGLVGPTGPRPGSPRGLRAPRGAWDLFGAAKDLLGQDTSGGQAAPVREVVTPSEPLPAGPDAPEGFDSEARNLEILRYPHPALRRPNEPVKAFDGRLRQLADNLFSSMYARGDGIGLAAPQVGVNLRVMVYNPNPRSRDDETVFVNPRIVEVSPAKEVDAESCLSFPRMRGPVQRHRWVKVQAVDWDGCPFERSIYGFEARLFQHEYDHLDGVVYVDRLADSSRAALQPDLDFLVEDYRRAGGADEAP